MARSEIVVLNFVTNYAKRKQMKCDGNWLWNLFPVELWCMIQFH